MHQRDETFVTFGDAISSWLDKLDTVARGDCLCLMSKTDARSDVLDWRISAPASPHAIARVSPVLRRWGAAISIKR